jgi:hypothetical protein
LAAQKKQQEAFQRAAQLKQMLAGLEKVDDEGRRHSLLDALTVVDDVLALPVHPSPPGRSTGELKVDLLKHQVRCLNDRKRTLALEILDLFFRVKHFNGQLIAKTRNYPRRKQTNLCNFGK